MQNASSGTDTSQIQLSNHWTVIGDVAFMEIETPVRCILLICVCSDCLYTVYTVLKCRYYVTYLPSLPHDTCAMQVCGVLVPICLMKLVLY